MVRESPDTAGQPLDGASTGAWLTIGDLAARTGLSAATLRVWESRHGFPRPHRLGSGHRRYTEADVVRIDRVVQHKAAGLRLDQAIARSTQEEAPSAPSIYAHLRERHPALATYRLRKQTLIALSWAIEDEFCAQASDADMYAAFQRGRYFEQASDRWREIARVSRSTTVFADFEHTDLEAVPARVALAESAPLRREWAVVCDAPDLPVVLTAWEVPGQAAVRDRDRLFESIWTVDPGAVHDAARVCAMVAGQPPLPAQQRRETPPPVEAVTRLFNRMVSYVDRMD